MQNETKLMNEAFRRMKANALEQFNYYYEEAATLRYLDKRTEAQEKELRYLQGKMEAFDEEFGHINRLHKVMISENR